MTTDTLKASGKPAALKKLSLPEIDFSQISNLTDDTGMIQHAVFNMPNRKEGYCIDDNARALLLAVWAGKDKQNILPPRLLPIYLSFIHYMQTDDGYFRNFMTYTKACEEERGSEDSFGRTIMALGFLINESRSSHSIRNGVEMFLRAYPHIDKLTSLRGIANSIIGVCQFVKHNYPDDIKMNLVIKLSDKIIAMYRDNNKDNWHWFEPILTYDNAMIPLALLNAYEITQDETYLSVAIESMTFLESKVFHKKVLRPIGNMGWCTPGSEPAQFDQQGIDVMAMVLFYQQAFRVTREEQYRAKMYSCHLWFLGANDLRLSLYDPTTGGCADGLQAEGINFNQGAESTLAYWISHLVVNSVMAE